jgi:hypothetical protein
MNVPNLNLPENVFFFHIGAHRDTDTYFYWTSENYHKNPYFQIKLIRNAPQKNIFYTLPNPDLTIVYIVHNNTIFSIGANPEIQSQLLEAMLEHLIERFFDIYDESLLSTCFGETSNIFSGFKEEFIKALRNFHSLDLIETALVNCKACGKTFKIVIKKSLVEKNESENTIPLVYIHSGHALMVYIDHQYNIRGNHLVSVSY